MRSRRPSTIAEARDRLRSGDLGAIELTEACLRAAEEATALNAFSALTAERARYQASLAEVRLKQGDAPDLCGVPLGIKDLFCVEDTPTQAASRILEGFRPPYESTVTRQLWDAGAVCVGKLNMDEFAMGSSNETSVYGPAVSPWRRRWRHRCAHARRLVGRLGCGGRGRPLPRRHRHRYRRLDPPAGRLHRPRRRQADLRPLLALGHRRLRLLARPGRPAGEVGARRRHPAPRDGRARPAGTRPRPTGRCPTSRRR